MKSMIAENDTSYNVEVGAMFKMISPRSAVYAEAKKCFEEYTNTCNLEEIIPIINIDKQVIDRELTVNSVKDLEKLEPYGEANKCPLFLYKNLKIERS